MSDDPESVVNRLVNERMKSANPRVVSPAPCPPRTYEDDDGMLRDNRDEWGHWWKAKAEALEGLAYSNPHTADKILWRSIACTHKTERDQWRSRALSLVSHEVRHKAGCYYGVNPCTCGLDALRKAIEESQG